MARHTMNQADLVVLQQSLTEFAAFCAELHTGVAADAATVGAAWSGEAASRFEELHAMWAPGAAHMTAGAEAMTTVIATSGLSYADAGEANTQVWF